MSVEQGSGGDGRSAGVAARQHARAWLAGALTWRFLETVMPAPLVGYVAAAAGVALVSALIGVILAWRSVGNLPMLYLVVVLATAIRFGRGPAVMASIAAFLTFEWFFIAPAHTLTVGDPQEWIALLLLLVVSVVTGQLAAGQRQRANEAQRREREARALYALGRILNAQDDLSAALTAPEAAT